MIVDALSDRLHAQVDLSLDQSVQISQQTEACKQQRGVVRDSRNVNTSGEFVKRNQRSSTKPNTARHSGKCKLCGSQPQHDRNGCPARQATCHHFNKVGHFRSVSASGSDIKPPHSKQNAHNVGHVFLGEIPGGKCWTAEVMIDGKSKVQFELDSGAEVSVLSDKYTLFMPRPCSTVCEAWRASTRSIT